MNDLENAVADSWPVPWVLTRTEYEVRASPESSNRGNCVRPFQHPGSVSDMLEQGGVFLEQHGRPLRVLTPQRLRTLNEDLMRRRFVRENTSLCMTRLSGTSRRTNEGARDDVRVQLRGALEDEWLSAWAVCAPPGSDAAAVSVMARRPETQTVYALVTDRAGGPLAVGATVQSGRHRVFVDLATRAGRRGEGLGRFVVDLLSDVPGPMEVDALQVDDDNPAVALYRRAGFTVAYEYHYMRAPAPRTD